MSWVGWVVEKASDDFICCATVVYEMRCDDFLPSLLLIIYYCVLQPDNSLNG